MSSMTYTIRDSSTMLRRSLKHQLRYPSMTLMIIGIPVVFLLMFVYVFGGTMGAGLGGAGLPDGGRTEYLEYLVPGILVMGLAGSAQGTAISIAMDMTEGIVARFKTMSISRASVLTGHVLGSLIQAVFGIAVVIGVAVLLGFRSGATPIEWLATFGVIALASLALTWLSVALGMWAKSVESASNLPMPLLLLPFFGSGFVPTDSMPTGLQWFAEYQPFTPIIETLRGLLTGSEIGNSGWIAIAWCVGISLVGYLWARKLYNRDPSA